MQALQGKFSKQMWKRGKNNGEGGGDFKWVFEKICKSKNNDKNKINVVRFVREGNQVINSKDSFLKRRK